MRNILVQFRRRYFILRPRKCQKIWMSQILHINPSCTLKLEFGKIQKLVFGYNSENCILFYGRENVNLWMSEIPPFYPFVPLELRIFEKCRNWFLGICMKNVLKQFRRRYLISRLRKSKKHECHRYPVFTLEKQNFANPFLSTPLHTHTDMSSKFHVSNFNSQDILFYIYKMPPFYPFVPFKFEFWKMEKSVFRYFYEECFSTIPKTNLILRPRTSKKHECHGYPILTL